MSELRLKLLWFLEHRTMKGFPKLGKITQKDIEWGKKTMSAILITQILNMIQAGFNWLTARGISRNRVQAMLDEKHASNDDFTTAEVQTELDTLTGELNETENLIDNAFDSSD